MLRFQDLNMLMIAGKWLFLLECPTKMQSLRHPVNLLNERTLKGTFFGNYKPRSDLASVVEKYMKKDLKLEKNNNKPSAIPQVVSGESKMYLQPYPYFYGVERLFPIDPRQPSSFILALY